MIMSTLSDSIRNKLNESIKNKALKITAEERTQLLSELTEQSETRYKTTVDAIKRAKMYLTWIVEAGSALISPVEQEKYAKFFAIKQDVTERKAVEASAAEKTIAKLVEQGVFNEKIHHNQIKAYYHSKNGQITLQKQVFQKENEVGNLFILFVQDFIQRNYRQIEHQNPQNALTLAKALKVIKQDSLNIQDILKLNYHAMIHSVDQLQNHLDSRKDKLEILNKVVSQLQEVMDVMEDEPGLEEKPKPSNRMAYASKQ